MTPKQEPEIALTTGRPELAHVLFMDLVSHSQLPMEEQRQHLAELQELILSLPPVREAESERNLICLPTGDGMALVFFQDPIRAAECAIDTARALKSRPNLKLRMGLNTGPIFRIPDINSNLNVSGAGINEAQRIMDAGDAGHILLAASTAAVLAHLGSWKPYLRDLGEHPVKHGVKLHFFNLCTPDVGVASIPTKLAAASSISNNAKTRGRMMALLSTVTTKLAQRRIATLSVLGILGLLLTTSAILWLGQHRPSAETMRWYDEGSRALRDATYYTAMRSLERAVELDTNFSLAHARLAEAAAALDYDEKAKSELLRVSFRSSYKGFRWGLEAFRQEAIYCAVIRDFPCAEEKYKKLEERAPKSEKPELLVDLGRAYEANRDIEKAIASYSQSIDSDQQYAAAFLLRGILSGRKQDPGAATKDFDKAEALYRAEGRAEGLTEVLYQRALMFSRIGDNRARAMFEEVLQMARQTANDYQQARALLMLSNISYMQADTSAGRSQAEEAIELSRRAGIEVLATSGLVDLGTALFVKGDYPSAEHYLRNAIALAKRLQSLRVEARASFSLGNVLFREGHTDEALLFTKQAADFYRRGGYRTEAARALIPMGRALREKGRLGEAAQLFSQQSHIAEQVGDKLGLALAEEGLGSVLILQENFPQALASFDRALAANRSLNDQLGVAYSLMNRAGPLWQLGRYYEAETSLSEAASVSKALGENRPLSADISATFAEMALSQGKYREAEEYGRMAQADASDDPKLVGDLKRIMALVQMSLGRTKEAEVLCNEVLSLARTTESAALLQRTQLVLAEVKLASGDRRNASALAVQVATAFEAQGQSESQWRSLAVAAAANRGQGVENNYTVEARKIMDKLRLAWGSNTYELYLSRPDIQQFQKWLDK
jgi:tetratricopeptide (TPR) repeat protein